MRYKPKNAKTVFIIVILVVLATVLAGWSGIASIRSAVRIGYSGHAGWSSWSGTYSSLDGTMQKSIHPKEDVLHVEVMTKKGSIAITIKDKEGTVIFDESNIGTSSFDVKVTGKVTVKIVAEDHTGSFSIE